MTRQAPEVPSTEEDIVEVMSDFVYKQLLDVHTMIPGRIISYEGHETRKAQVEVSVRLPTNTGEFVDVAPIGNVPVMFPGGANSSILLPVKKGDGVLLLFSEVGIGNFLNGKVTVDADNFSRFNLTDCVAIPGLYSDADVPEIQVDQNSDDLIIYHKQNKIQMSDESLLLEREDMSVELFPDGKISINGVTEELMALLSEILQTLSTSTVITGIGPQPFTPTSVTNFSALKTRLDTLKV